MIWQEILDETGRQYAVSLQIEMERKRPLIDHLMRSIAREERRRDPYERLTRWMKSLPTWRDQACNCGEYR